MGVVKRRFSSGILNMGGCGGPIFFLFFFSTAAALGCAEKAAIAAGVRSSEVCSFVLGVKAVVVLADANSMNSTEKRGCMRGVGAEEESKNGRSVSSRSTPLPLLKMRQDTFGQEDPKF